MEDIHWYIRKRNSARVLMKNLGMEHEKDEGKCPRCGQIINERGSFVDGKIKSKSSNHIGSMRCLTQISREEVFSSNEEWQMYVRYGKMCDLRKREGRTLCKCGCGEQVDCNINGVWNQYVYEHYEHLQRKKTILKALKMLEKEQGSVTQASLHNEDLPVRRVGKYMNILENEGFIERKKIRVGRYWTYEIKKTGKEIE